MSTRFFTNDGENTLLKKFAGVFAHNPEIERFDALVGYLRASGYFALRPHLEKVPFIRVLVGIDVDKIVADYHRKGLLFLTDSSATLDELKSFLLRDIQSAEYRPEIERGILQFVEDVVTGKLQIRAHPTKRLHAKIYIFRPQGFNEHKTGAVITGSSNLTGPGLGEGKGESNYEFNVLLHDYGDVKFATAEFEKLWEEGVEVLPAAIHVIDFADPAEKAAHDAIEGLVDGILTAKRAGDEATVKTLETKIDAHVFRLYGLTPEETALIQIRTP